MIYNSSVDELNMKKINPKKYLMPDETDRIFLGEYEEYDTHRKRAPSNLLYENSSKIIINNAKKRVAQVEQAEQKN